MHSANHVDREVLSTLQEIMAEDFPVLIETFLADSAERISALQRALATADSDAVRRAAHSFKGSCSNLGVQRLAELCQQMEERGHRGQLQGLECELIEIQQEFAQVRALLHTLT